MRYFQFLHKVIEIVFQVLTERAKSRFKSNVIRFRDEPVDEEERASRDHSDVLGRLASKAFRSILVV